MRCDAMWCHGQRQAVMSTFMRDVCAPQTQEMFHFIETVICARMPSLTLKTHQQGSDKEQGDTQVMVRTTCLVTLEPTATYYILPWKRKGGSNV